jgi:ubiquitin-conjugating enzyme E2 Q
MKQREAEEKSQ